MLRDAGRDPLAEREHLRPRLEEVLVEVVGRTPARAQDEVALQQRVVGEHLREVGFDHGFAAARSASLARASAAVASGVVGGRESIAPSS